MPVIIGKAVLDIPGCPTRASTGSRPGSAGAEKVEGMPGRVDRACRERRRSVADGEGAGSSHALPVQLQVPADEIPCGCRVHHEVLRVSVGDREDGSLGLLDGSGRRRHGWQARAVLEGRHWLLLVEVNGELADPKLGTAAFGHPSDWPV